MQQAMPLKGDAPATGTGHTSIMAHTIGQLPHLAGGMLVARNDRLENFLHTPKKEVKVD